MQLLSLAALGPEAQRLFEELSRKLAHDYTGEIIVFAAITFALWIVSAWVAATAVVKESTVAGGAVKTGVRWFTGFAAGVALAGAAFYFARLRGSGFMATASLAIGVILVAFIALDAPMGIYKIGLGRALAFGVIGIVVHLAAQVAVQRAMNDPLMLGPRLNQARRLAALSPEEASEVLRRLQKVTPAIAAPAPVAPAISPASAPEAPAPPPAKTIAERHGELKKVYADLMAQRESLHEGDDAALAAYTRDTADYVEKLTQLQKDADAGGK